jgi:glycosyltransferase involved in cell wall biosynthesis
MADVLLLLEYAALNGGERSLLAVLEDLQQSGYRMSAAAPPSGPLADELQARGVEVIPFDVCAPGGQRFSQTALRERLREIIVSYRPELVHANSLAMGRLSGPVVSDLGVYSVAPLRDMMSLTAAALRDLCCHTRLLAVSHATRSWYVERGVDPARIHVLYNGVDLDTFRPRPTTGYLHRELGLADDAKLIGSIGQISLRKGFDTVVASARLLAASHPRVHWLIVGERHAQKDETRQFEEALRQASASPPLAGRLHLLGRRDDVPRLLNELAVLVHPARQEPLGRVLLEAAASGVPVVATDVGGTAEIFPPDSQAAVLVPPDNAEAMARAMGLLLDNAVLEETLATGARRRAESMFDARQSAASLARHYSELLSGHESDSKRGTFCVE